ncbi:hypothetical protein [Peribacillus muralis]|uniref:GntT/GntP/DsdX family permease n=1 Tax=Peribacillus muralis TaxID=264697 RepID=UPI002147A3A5|nr:hypothetical protein [Peribacillus muralis]
MPVILVTVKVAVEIFMPVVDFIGIPAIACMISVIIAIFTFRLNRGNKRMKS